MSVAVPCYNEEAIIEASYRRIKDTCEAQGVTYEIIFGNDGSSDATLGMLEALAASDPAVRITSHSPNRGAGYTYRELYGAARGDIIIQMDCDLAMPVEVSIPTFLEALKTADVAVGSRYVGIKADYPLKRRIFSRGYTMLTRMLFDLSVVDTQTGFMGFYRKILPALDLNADGFELLVEFIAQANAAGFHVAEVGLPWFHDTTSGETEVWSESMKMLAGTLRVKRRFNRLKKQKSRTAA
ncbi:MAG: glycosyltransferase family 2 protein [Thermoleophilia bacterium]|nr:glycosyltransferase family 2 protein [Thermoleophilia bacterium]